MISVKHHRFSQTPYLKTTMSGEYMFYVAAKLTIPR
jgi:hypothetical protein